jgi:hypothetical protein
MTLTQAEVDMGCKQAMQRYLEMDERDSCMKLAYEVQGFVAACVQRGASVDFAICSVVELLGDLHKANHESLEEMRL